VKRLRDVNVRSFQTLAFQRHVDDRVKADNDGRLISKDHCNQLLGANSWFKKNYDNTCRSVPILIHPNHKFQNEASPSPDMRIIDNEKLTKLRQSVRSLGAAVAKLGNFQDEPGIGKQLDQYNFTAAKFVAAFSRPFST
jgi:hypothetical protein